MVTDAGNSASGDLPLALCQASARRARKPSRRDFAVAVTALVRGTITATALAAARTRLAFSDPAEPTRPPFDADPVVLDQFQTTER